MQRRTFNQALLGLAAGATSLARAQESWPTRPIKVILPFSAGGTGDAVARALAASMAPRLGQPMVIENRVGGTGVIGQDVAMRSPPDGYTMVAISISGVLAYHFQGRTIDFTKDFVTVGQVYSQYAAVVVNHHLPEMANVHTLQDLIAYAKANPGKLNYATQGTGSIGHLTMERTRQITGMNVVHVPYRGAAPAYNDLMAGHIQLMCTSLGALPYITAGKMRALGVAAPKRSPLLPECPTFREQGVELVASSWYGFAMPGGTPAPIVQHMARDLELAVEKPDVAEALRRQGTEPDFLPGPEFAVRINADFQQWGEVIRDNGIKVG
jgi:tripartite-type tricarboxylate transporter receptor subunit TctC